MDVTFNVNLNQIVDLNEKEQSLLLSLAGVHVHVVYYIFYILTLLIRKNSYF